VAAEHIYCSYQISVAAFHASFRISQIIGKESQPFMDGECVKECMMKILEVL
jgi:hypothetical protein